MTMKRLMIALVALSTAESSASQGAVAGPIPTMTGAVRQAAPDQTVDVYWRGYGPGLAFGFAAGAMAGAAPFYGSSPYYGAPAFLPYAQPIYAAPYAYPQVYARPVYPGYFAPYDTITATQPLLHTGGLRPIPDV